MEERRYIHLDGKMAVGWDESTGKLVLNFLDASMKPISGEPIVFRAKQAKFLSAHIVISVTKEGYDLYESTIRNVDPLLEEWDDLELVDDPAKVKAAGDVDDEDKMNTTNPPDPGAGGGG